MTSKLKKSQHDNNLKLTRVILFSGASITLIISPLAINAFNQIKLIALVLVTALVIYKFGIEFKESRIKTQRSVVTVAALLFIGVVSNLMFGANNSIKTGIEGTFGRNNGALTYLCLLIFLVVASAMTERYFVLQYLKMLNVLGSALSIYGLLQILGFDLVDYGDTKVSNPLFLTFGNTNFTSAFIGMSLMATISLGFIGKEQNHKKKTRNPFLLMSVALQGFVLYKAEATQGFIALGVGLAVFFFLLPLQSAKGIVFEFAMRGRKYTGMLLLGISFLGVFGIGPLSVMFASGARSLQDRYYHWIAGLSMFRDNPVFGVGLDSYGDWFKAYRTRDSIEFLETTRGFSNDAHNVYVQVAATGGLFFLIPFVLITFLVLFKVIRHLFSKEFSIEFLGVFSIWLVFQAQMIVSINQVGIAIWGWIAGGILINASFWDRKSDNVLSKLQERIDINDKLISKKGRNYVNGISQFVTLSLLLYNFLLLIPDHVREIQMKYVLIEYDETLQNSSSNRALVESVAKNLLGFAKQSSEPVLRFLSIEQLLLGGFTKEALEIATLTSKEFPREIDAWDAVAFIYENTGRPDLAIEARRKQFELDPLNPALRERLTTSNQKSD